MCVARKSARQRIDLRNRLKVLQHKNRRANSEKQNKKKTLIIVFFQCVGATSPIYFTVNYVQNRQISTALSVRLAKFYNDLDVHSEEAAIAKLDALARENVEICELADANENLFRMIYFCS